MPVDADPTARLAVATLAAVEFAIGGWMVAAPGSFFTSVAPFGARNDHLLRDTASWELALAGLALVAVLRPAWRVPVVALALVHFALHAVSHVVDVGHAEPGWIGPADLASLVVGSAALAWLLVRVRRSAT